MKVVIDAYNGTVAFYLMDAADPIAMTYQRIFPELFKPFAPSRLIWESTFVIPKTSS